MSEEHTATRRNVVSLSSLVCPGCGADLSGLDTDRVFGCLDCAVAYEPKVDGLAGPFPLRQSTHAPSGQSVTLPFWLLGVAPMLLPEEVSPPKQVVLPGFELRRRAVYGDPGLRWTSKRVELEVAEGDG